jgi:TetR/AcrR family transcriptional regulator, transcriptional repressor for nem operon
MMKPRVSSRDKILDTAKDLFYFVGYQTTSIDDILRESGVVKSNFYYHFPNKESLALAVLELRIAEYEAMVIESLRNTALSPSERLNHFFEHICRAQEQMQRMGGCPFGNLVAALPARERDASEERFRQRLSLLFREMEEAVRECLTEGVARREFRSDISPAEMASFLVASVQGLLILAKAHRDISSLVCGLSVAQRLLRTP